MQHGNCLHHIVHYGELLLTRINGNLCKKRHVHTRGMAVVHFKGYAMRFLDTSVKCQASAPPPTVKDDSTRFGGRALARCLTGYWRSPIWRFQISRKRQGAPAWVGAIVQHFTVVVEWGAQAWSCLGMHAT